MPKQVQQPRPKHVPQRTCIACRKVDAKRGLVRLVRLPEGRVAIDPSGKHAGRGAYICRERGCWEAALKRKAIERALHVPALAPDDRTALEDYHVGLPQGDADDKQEADSVAAE